MKTEKLLVAAISVLGFLAPMSAKAGLLNTLTQVQTYNFTSLNDTATLPFAGFNSALGNLNSVHFQWNMTETLDSVAFNMTNTTKSIGNPAPVQATATTTFTGSGIAFQLTNVDSITTPGFTGSIAPFSSITAGSITSTRNGGVCLSNDGSCGAGNTNLNNYIGGLNLFNIVISNLGTQGGSVPGGVLTGNNFLASGTVSLFYDYSPKNIPEPASLSLMGLGLTYIVSRRKKHSVF